MAQKTEQPFEGSVISAFVPVIFFVYVLFELDGDQLLQKTYNKL